MKSSSFSLSRQFKKIASTRSFVGGSGLALAVFLTGIRTFILRKELAGDSIIDGLSLIVVGCRQDWAVVFMITVAALVLGVGRGGRRGVTKGIAALVVLNLALLFWGIANIISVQMLGEPVTVSWIRYSDIFHSPVIAEQILHYLTPTTVLVIFLATVSFVATTILFAAMLGAGPKGLAQGLIVAPLAIIFLSFAFGNEAPRAGAGKLSNPALALGRSIFAADQSAPQFAGLNGTSEGLSALPIERATPVPRPEFEPGQIKNVIVIALESTPAKYADGFGGTFGLTPYLTEYAAMGHKFTNAYAHTPASNYFLVALLAAIVPDLSPYSMTYSYPDLELNSISDVLKDRGFRTGFFNSSDNRFQNTEYFVNRESFDTILDYRDWPCASGVYEFQPLNFLNTSNDLCTIKPITDWIGQDPDQPFFITFRTGMTHYPYFPGNDPQQYVEDEKHNRYLNAVRVGDQAFGKIMEYLTDADLIDSTLVVAVGDHGEAFGEHGNYLHGSAIYEENVHVPFVLVNPKLFFGETSDIVVGISDIAPTVADLLGIPAPPEWQGLSLFADNRRNGALFFAPWNGFQIGYRIGNTKFIYNGNSEQSWLFDLEADPAEQNNLADTAPEDTERAKAVLSMWVKHQNAWINGLLANAGEEVTQTAPLSGPQELVINATGVSYKSAPRGQVYIDGVLIGHFDVSRAPVNAHAPVSDVAIDAALTVFKFPIENLNCAKQLEIYFLNDEWAGEDQSGDTDLYIQKVEFAGRSYAPNEFELITERAGGESRGYFTLWRSGGLRVNLDVAPDCLTQALGSLD